MMEEIPIDDSILLNENLLLANSEDNKQEQSKSAKMDTYTALHLGPYVMALGRLFYEQNIPYQTSKRDTKKVVMDHNRLIEMGKNTMCHPEGPCEEWKNGVADNLILIKTEPLLEADDDNFIMESSSSLDVPESDVADSKFGLGSCLIPKLEFGNLDTQGQSLTAPVTYNTEDIQVESQIVYLLKPKLETGKGEEETTCVFKQEDVIHDMKEEEEYSGKVTSSESHENGMINSTFTEPGTTGPAHCLQKEKCHQNATACIVCCQEVTQKNLNGSPEFLSCTCASGCKQTLQEDSQSEGGFNCPVCHRIFKRHSYLKAHMPTHSNQRKHYCNVCDKTFKRADHLRRHVAQLHTKKPTISCSLCDKMFISSNQLKKHMITHTGEERFPCSDCSKSFTALSALKRHTITHSGVRPHICTTCGRSFRDHCELMEHSFLHSGKSYLNCNQCKKTFTSSSGLRRHVLLHKNEKKFRCNLCERSFIQLYALRIHSMQHTGEKPHICSICNKSFLQRFSLTNHMSLHTKNEEFICNICKRTFHNRKALTKHLRRHTTQRHRCNICDKTLCDRSALNRHMIIHVGK